MNGYFGKRTVVLGASGFIGRWVARYLCRSGATVYLFVRSIEGAEKVFSEYSIDGEIVETDLRRPEPALSLIRKIRPTITFNLAGYGIDRAERDEEAAFTINARLVKALCEAVDGVTDRGWPYQDVVHAGSALEYGAISGDLDESSPPNPTTLYGRSKLAGTYFFSKCCKMHNVRGLTARLFTVYGPGEHKGRLLPSLMESARTGRPLGLTDGLHKRDFTYVEEVAEGMLRLGLSKAEPGCVVNLATGRLASVRDFSETAARVLGIPKENLKFGRIPTRAEEMEHSEIALMRLKDLTEWTPTVGIEEGVARTVSFMNVRLDSGRY